jgi:hypothetical protein
MTTISNLLHLSWIKEQTHYSFLNGQFIKHIIVIHGDSEHNKVLTYRTTPYIETPDK